MKFLHLADLHIGKSVNGFNMIGEQRNAFSQIIAYIKSEQPRALIIAGDVFDRAVPSAESVALYGEFLTALCEENIDILLIAGNHDSPERLDYAHKILEKMRLHISGCFQKEPKKVTLADEFGSVNFHLLPFVKPTSVRSFFPENQIESYSDALQSVINSMNIDKNERNVLISHQFFAPRGTPLVRSDSEVSIIGGLDEIDSAILCDFDYVALGHLHGAQRVGTNQVRYAGSPLKYSFSECDHNKCVLLVELNEKGALKIDELPIKPLHDLRQIRGSFHEILGGDTAIFGSADDYLKIVLTDTDEIIDPMNKLRAVYPNAMILDFENIHINTDLGNFSDCDHQKQLSEFELFCQFYREVNDADLTDEQLQIVGALLDEEAQNEAD